MPQPAPAFSWRSIAVAAYGPTFLSSIGLGAAFPVVALLALQVGATQALAAFLVSLLGIGSLLASIPASVLTARIGEKWAMAASGTAYAVMLAGLSVAGSPLTVGALVAGCGVFGAVFGIARQTYLTEAVPLAMRARALSTLGGTFRLGMFLGPLVGAALIGGLSVGGTTLVPELGLRSVFVYAALAELAAVALVLTIPELDGDRGAQMSAGVSVTRLLKDHQKTFATIGLMCALLMAVRGCRQVVIPLWGDHLGLGERDVSLVAGLGGGMDIAVFYLGGLVMDRRGRRLAGMLACGIMGLALFLLPLTTSWGTLLLVALLVGFGNGFGSGIVMTLGADYSPDLGRPQFLGVFRFITDAGNAGGPMLLSWVTGLAGLAWGVLTIGGVAAVATALFALWVPGHQLYLERREAMAGGRAAPPALGDPAP